MREEARRRDHRELYDLLAGLLTAFVEEGRQSGRSVVSEPLALLSHPLVNQVSPTRYIFMCGIPPYARIHKTL